MRVELTTQDLLDAGACESGIQHFKWLTGGRLNLKWTKLHSVWLIRSPMRDDYLWAVSRKLLPLDLSGADLSGANLFGANLSGADLFGANLSRANLDGADLGLASAPAGWSNKNGYAVRDA